MARLHDPDPDHIPEDVGQFLSTLPPDPMFRMLSHSVTTVQPLLALARSLYTSLNLPVRTRELAILVLADLIDSTFVWTQHVPISGQAGIDDRVRRLVKSRNYDDPELALADRIVAQFVSAVIGGPTVSDELFTALRDVLSEREIVELLQVIGYYWTFGRISTVLEVELTHMYGQDYEATFLDTEK